MIKHLLKFGLAVAACSLLLSPREASAVSSGFPNWQACDDYMYRAHVECIQISRAPGSGVTAAMCEASWEVTCDYCDDTFENVCEVPEVVIHIVKYDMVQQMSLSSTEYAKGVNEFNKSGLTEVPSVMVKPPRVAEAPVAFECKVLQVIPMGSGGGAGNLVICEVVYMHIDEAILDSEGKIDPFKLDAVARLGSDWYCRVQGNAIFKVPKPLDKVGIGIDQLPERIRLSKTLTGNDLGLLANIQQLPTIPILDKLENKEVVKKAIMNGEEALHQLAHHYLEKGNLQDAWSVLLSSELN